LSNLPGSHTSLTFSHLYTANTRHSSRDEKPERDVTYIVLSVYLLTLIHRYPLDRKQSH